MPLEQTLALGMIIIGIIMLVAEASVPGNFLIVPSTVLIVLGFIGLIAPDVLFSWFSPLLAIVILIPTTYLTIKLYQRLSPPALPETLVGSSIVGRTGRVTSEVYPNSLKGKVRVRARNGAHRRTYSSLSAQWSRWSLARACISM